MNRIECPQCGAPLDPDATECRYCGEKLNHNTNNSGSNPESTTQTHANYESNNQNGTAFTSPDYPNNNYQNNNQYAQRNNQGYYPYGAPYMSNNVYPMLDPGVNPAWPYKNKITAGILAILLGWCGVHKFYLGKSSVGVLYLLFCWTGIPAIAGFIEGITYLCSNDHNFQVKHHVRIY